MAKIKVGAAVVLSVLLIIVILQNNQTFLVLGVQGMFVVS